MAFTFASLNKVTIVRLADQPLPNAYFAMSVITFAAPA